MPKQGKEYLEEIRDRNRAKGNPLQSPEFWDEVFKPRGPLGLLGGQTFLGMVPVVGQGLAAVDAAQGLREGSALQTLGGFAGMLPGGRIGKLGVDAGDKVIDLAKARAKRGPRSPERELKLGPKGAKEGDIVPQSILDNYRVAIENWKAKVKLQKFNEEFGLPKTPPKKDFGELVDKGATLIDSVDNLFKGFLKPGKLNRGDSKTLRSAYTVLEDHLNKGLIPLEALEEAEAVITALDDAGAISNTDQVVELINALLQRATRS